MKTAGEQVSNQIRWYFLSGILILALSLTGGYTQFSAALLVVILGGVLVFLIWKEGKVVVSCDIHVIAFALVCFMYLITVLWAVDRGMALEGFIHFLPIFLFYSLICRNMDLRERLIGILPVLGSLMTLFSFIMMQFPVFQNYVSVANRLSGFFQYPNTYALFMLISFIVAAHQLQREKIDWLDIVHCGIAVFGIYMSGSRTTFLLLLGILFLYIIRIRKLRKMILPLALALLIVVAILGITGITGNLFGRLFDLSFRSSTFLGRLLYAQDALKLIWKQPFGYGYYGYYFLQTEIQTGVYSVANVHNELLQMMMDVGMIPALLFYGMMLATICQKSVPIRNRMVVFVLFFHSLLDYDFQFLSICFILILFLNLQNVKEYAISMVTKAISAVGFIAVILGAGCVGISDLLMMEGQFERSIQVYNGNTLARTYLLTELEDIEELNRMAASIAEDNQHVPLAYHAMAQVALAKGKILDYLKYKEKAMELAPYDFESYTGYLDALSYCFGLYIKNGEKESANICLQKAKAVPECLEQLKEKTTWLGWQIDDTPQVTLPWEYQKMIETMQEEYSQLTE